MKGCWHLIIVLFVLVLRPVSAEPSIGPINLDPSQPFTDQQLNVTVTVTDHTNLTEVYMTYCATFCSFPFDMVLTDGVHRYEIMPNLLEADTTEFKVYAVYTFNGTPTTINRSVTLDVMGPDPVPVGKSSSESTPGFLAGPFIFACALALIVKRIKNR